MEDEISGSQELPVTATIRQTLLKELKKIWGEVGRAKAERNRMLLELEQDCLEVYRRKVDQEDKHRAELKQKIADCEAELAAVRSAMGDILLANENPKKKKKKKKKKKEKACQNQGSLNDRLKYISSELENIQKIKCGRWNQFFEVSDQILKIKNEIYSSGAHISTNVVVDESDLSLRKLGELQKELDLLQSEKSKLQQQGLEHLSMMKSLCVVLGMDFEVALREVHPSLVESEITNSFSNETIKQLAASIGQLGEVKVQRMKQLQNLASSMLKLWEFVNTPTEVKLAFKDVISINSASAHEITKPNILSVNFINYVEAEVSCLEESKVRKMNQLILKKKSELEEICRKSLMIPESNNSLGKVTEAIESGVVAAAHVLGQIELQIEKVEEEDFSPKEILEKVEKWMSARKEEYNKDDNRYNSGRDAHPNPKPTEEARALANKLPGTGEASTSKTRAWENERGLEITSDRTRFLSILKEYTMLCQEKEEFKKQRERKNLEEQLIVEQEAEKNDGDDDFRASSADLNIVKSDMDPMLDMSVEFENWPSYHKRCFLYCLLFPLSYEFERDMLVQLWMAEELIEGEKPDKMEENGYNCIAFLESRQYILFTRFDRERGQFKYKVNEAKLSNSSRDIGSMGSIVINHQHYLDDISETTLHLSLSCERLDPLVFETLPRFKCLRTLLLLVRHMYCIRYIPSDLFLSLKSLRTLDLSGTDISELPSSVQNLKELRYLDTSYTEVRALPDTLCFLFNLQTLKVLGCGIRELPKRITRLINLRHLDFDSLNNLKSMPKDIGQMVNLRTFSGFVVARGAGYGIEELRYMDNITGSFSILALQTVRTVEEAKSACLSNKKYIKKLKLQWTYCIDADSEQEIIEYLLPSTSIEELELIKYSGSVLPSWISDPSFSSIIRMELAYCVECNILPPIGNLPSLKFLEIVGMKKVTDISGLFSSSYGDGDRCAVSKLEELSLDQMLNLERWCGEGHVYFPCLVRLEIAECPKLSDLQFLSRSTNLQSMGLVSCNELQSFPGRLPTSLKFLTIHDCPNLKERCLGEDWWKIANVSSISVDGRGISKFNA